MTSKVFAASPKTPTDVVSMFQKENIFTNFGLTLHEGQEKTAFFKVCHDSKDFAYCVFGSDKIVKLINENIPDNNNKKILIDGTFSIVPLGCFKQLILLQIKYYEKVCPRGEGGERGRARGRESKSRRTARAATRFFIQ